MKFNFNFSRLSGRTVLNSLIEIIYLAVVFATPLWFAYWFPTYNIFEFNKIILFKILTWLLLFFTILKLIFYSPRPNFSAGRFFRRYWLAPLIFIVGLSLILIWSSDPAQSFYGTIERQQGLSSYLLYFLWFILVSFNVLVGASDASTSDRAIPKKIRRIIMAAVLSGFLVAGYGVLQIINIDFVTWPEEPYLTHRALSSLGQPNFLASWLLLVIPLAAYLLLTSRRFLIRFFWLLAGLTQIVCLFFTGSRGGLVAFFLTSFMFLVYLFIVSTWPRRKKIFISLIFIVAAIISLFFLDYFSEGRLRELKNRDYGSWGARTSFYQAAADAISNKPLLGYGLENSAEVFIKYYRPEWGVYGDVNQSPDRAHNLFLDILLTSGAVGLLLFLVLYYFFCDLVRLNLREKKMPDLSLALFLGVAAYLLSLFFSFTIVSGEIYFWLFLALLIIINVSYKTGWQVETAGVPIETARFKLWFILKIVVALILALVILAQISLVFKALSADYYLNQAYLALASNDYRSVLLAVGNLSDQKINPVNRASYYSFLGEKISAVYPVLTDPVVKVAIGDRLKEWETWLPARGYHNLLAKAKINGALGNISLGQTYLASIIALTPHWPLAYLHAGQLAWADGNSSQALSAYYLAALNLPLASDSRLNAAHRQNVLSYHYFINKNIGDIYQEQKNYATAEKYYQLAYRSNPLDLTLLKKISDTYYYRGDVKRAMQYSLHGLARNPHDYHWPLAVSALYYESGDKVRARDYLRQALSLAPDNGDLKTLEKEYNK